LQQNPGGTKNQVRQKLEEDYDKKLGKGQIRKLLLFLTRLGEIERAQTESGYT